MSDIKIWAGPRLLVPIKVDALVVAADNAVQYSIKPLALNNYNSFINISPDVLSTDGVRPQKGVHLNWALPDSMTNGQADKDGRVAFPYLPNRWMIVRFSADPTVKRQICIIKSDELSDTASEQPDGSPPLPQYLSGTDTAEVKFIGQWYEITEGNNEPVKKDDKFVEDGQSTPQFLTAIGNSDPLFAAYSCNNTYVFSFIDTMDYPDKHTMSYLVTGWFSNPEYDILYDKSTVGKGWVTEQDWLDVMDGLQWSVGGDTIANNQDLENARAAGQKWLKDNNITPLPGLQGSLCAQTLCHGLVFGVEWPGIDEQAPSNVPIFNTQSHTVPYVATANAATDCLSAFMQWQLNYNNPSKGGKATSTDKEVEIMLEAFSHKMLNQDGGVLDTPELMQAIRETWFGRLPGGSVWVAQAPQKDGNLTTADTTQTPVQLTTQLATALAQLNIQQANHDKKYRLLITSQKQLYADWLKLNIYVKSPFPPEFPGAPNEAQLTQAVAASLAPVNGLMNEITTIKSLIKSQVAALTADLKTAGNMQLLEKPANDFYSPNDPVFLVNNADRNFKRGDDVIYSEYNDFLFTRFSGQFVKSITVGLGTTGAKLITANQICPAFITRSDIPKEVGGLLAEAYLLDPGFAPVIAKLFTNNPTAAIITGIASQQTLIWNKDVTASIDSRTTEQIAGFNVGDQLFHVPSKMGVWAWDQPWTPLFLEWQIGFTPAVDTDLSQWQFNGTDFNWAGGVIPDENGYIFTGRSILTPKEATTLQSRLREFIDGLPEPLPANYVPLNDVLDSIGNWDILSQTLTGLSLKLVHWDIEQFGYQPEDPTYKAAIGNEAHGMPILTTIDQFFPVRAGFVNIQGMWIVDDFGQVYNLMPSNTEGSAPPPLHPIPGIGVRPDKYKINLELPGYFQLPPRVIQGSRLNFNFLSAINDAIISSEVSDSTPVSGWVVTNHLNNSVMLYDNAGIYIGEIMLMGATGDYHAQWVPAPLTGMDAWKISNKHLNGFVAGLLGAANTNQGTTWSGQALKNFMKTIDETLWSVDPMGERSNQSLSILVGRPIAVVRAAVNLELYGKPDYNLAWQNTGKKDTGNIEQYKFPVQIGNIELDRDGVMGYYVNDDYTKFNSVHNGEVTIPAKPPYVVNTFTNLQFEAAPTVITLLLDPRGDIHCSTGILPVLTTVLPDLYIGKVLDNMLIEFKAGPLLVDEKQWWVPLPAGVGQKWSWLQPKQTAAVLDWDEITALVSATPYAQLSDAPQTIVEGRLKLAGALGDQMMLYFFQVNDAGTLSSPYSFKKGSLIQLSWSSQGAQSATLTLTDSAKKVTTIPVPVNQSAYSYIVEKSQTLVLTISDGTVDTQSITIVINAI